MDGMESKVSIKMRRVNTTYDLVLRILAFLLTLVAAIVIGINKQTKVVPIKVLSNFPPLNIPVTAKWQYQSSFVYLFVANIIACSYAAVSLILSIVNKGGNKGLVKMIIILDQLVMALLFSSSGAAGAVGHLAYTGNSHVQWQKVCNAFDKFCGQAAASIALTLFGSLAFLLLVTFAALGPHEIPN